MGRKAKFSFEVKMDIVKRCLAGKTTANHEAQLLEIHAERVYEWISLYKSLGTEGLVTTSKNTFYSSATKESAVRELLSVKLYAPKSHIFSQIKRGNSISLSDALHSRLSYPVPLWYDILDILKQLWQEPPRPKFGFLP